MLLAWETIRANLADTFANNRFLILYVISLLYLFFFEKEKRRILVYPSLLLSFLILNPLLYQTVYSKMLDTSYWRMFWLLPIVPVIAAAVVCLTSRIKHKTLKTTLALLLCLVIAGNGYYIYHHPLTSFEEATNPYKIPQETIDIIDYLHTIEPTPAVVMPPDLYLYAKQYTADIHLMYGRDAEGYITAIYNEHQAVYYMLNGMMETDLQYVVDIMHGSHNLYYHYLIISEDSFITEDMILSAGFFKVNSIDGYGIYYLV